jgi:hypothetical protein
MKKLLGALTLIFAYTFSYTQTYNIANVDGTTITTCSGTFIDSGVGSFNDYGNNEDYTVTFCSGSSTPLSFDFNDFGMANGDFLYVHAGTSTAGELIMELNSGDDISFNDLGLATLDTCVTFHFVSNGSGADDGWNVSISCTNPPAACNGNEPAADVFYYATNICNLDGYCGNTGPYYSEDNPYNFVGGGNCPTTFGGTIQNNSWLQFQATGTTIDLDFTVTGCSDGIQVAILEWNGSNFVSYSPCALSDGNNNGSFTLSGTGLTPGDNYYIMIDGNAGSNCNYAINIDPTDVNIIDAGSDVAICTGASTTLTATGPAGATYEWNSTDGSFGPVTGASITVSPGSTLTYEVTVTGGGYCEDQTDQVTVTVNPCSGCDADAGTWD